MDKFLTNLNSNKFLPAIAIVLSNLGGKYLTLDLNKKTDKFLQKPIIRRSIVFLIAFLASRDIIDSLIVTFIYVIFVKEMDLFDDDDDDDDDE